MRRKVPVDDIQFIVQIMDCKCYLAYIEFRLLFCHFIFLLHARKQLPPRGEGEDHCNCCRCLERIKKRKNTYLREKSE